ncbi:hypothetical protein FRC03_012472 [Tulasnella sp. 419]|nr:hypothetical protein FRC02_002470 [Tulasnella sp. 418]KAG8966147.1 hypothetical protein FRC03_012472 [Tulasnella sp. 419]
MSESHLDTVDEPESEEDQSGMHSPDRGRSHGSLLAEGPQTQPLTRLEFEQGINAVMEIIDRRFDALEGKLDALLGRVNKRVDAATEKMEESVSEILDLLSDLHVNAVFPLGASRSEGLETISEDASGSQPPSTVAQPESIVEGCIPDLVVKNGEPLWRCAISDWQNADPERGLMKALKDWPKSWYTGKENREKYAVKRLQRRLIAEEYIIRCGGDDTVFFSRYPDANTIGISHLIDQIRNNNPELCKKRSSKNGTAEERASRKAKH